MPRAAGSSHVYTFGLRTKDDGPKLPSVTHIIKYLKDELGFGGMAYWGMKIGVLATLINLKQVDVEMMLDDPDLEAYYTSAKETGWEPNKVRDAAGETGTGAHELLEHAAIGDILVELDSDLVTIQVTGAPEILAPIRYPEAKKAPQRKKWIEDKRTRMVPRGKGLAAARWWLDNEDKHSLAFPELPVYSLRYGYAGTMDFARILDDKVRVGPEGWESIDNTNALEVIDYKSHKPAAGMHKDGTYAEGKGPAYIDDFMQTRAYAQALYEMGYPEANAFRVVLLQPDGTYYEDTRTVDFELFLDFKTIHDKRCPKPECRLLARSYGGR